MAEGYLRHFASDRFNTHSAGTDPKDNVHPLAVQVMAEDGIDISDQQPKDLKKFLGRMPVRYLLIVCGNADKSCPRIWPGLHERLFWPLDDPAEFKGSEKDTLNEFRRVRNEIKQRILNWLSEIK